jgi:hypothetical protein
MRVTPSGARLPSERWLCLISVLALACASSHGDPDDAGQGPARDAGVDEPRDASCCVSDCCGAHQDGEADVDAAQGDDATFVDAALDDAWAALDAALDVDAWTATDAGRRDVDASSGGADASVRGDAGICHAWPTAAIHVLFIGNSQIDVSNLPRIVEDLSESAPADCARIVSDHFTLGGANLHDLWESPLPDGRVLADTIATGHYDVVVIAESIDLAEFIPTPFPARFVDYATRIIDASRAAGSVPLLYATPYIDAPDRSGFHAMADPQLALGRTLGVGVAAGGLAWLRVWDEAPDLDLHAADHAHPSYEGSYLSSLVIWAAITGGDPIGLSHTMTIFCDTGPCPTITDAHASLFQRAAWAEVLATGP